MPNIERRSMVAELRMDETEGSRIVRGHAVPWDSLSVKLWTDRQSGLPVHERFQKGAFRDVLKDDVLAVFNHNRNLLLGRTPETLRLSEDDVGLAFEIDVARTTAGNDLLVSVDRADVRGVSFAFHVMEDGEKWDREEGMLVRTVLKVSALEDVSPVTNPAYQETDLEIARRSLESSRAPARRLSILRRRLDIAEAEEIA